LLIFLLICGFMCELLLIRNLLMIKDIPYYKMAVLPHHVNIMSVSFQIPYGGFLLAKSKNSSSAPPKAQPDTCSKAQCRVIGFKKRRPFSGKRHMLNLVKY
jgi:hypothetical protein